MELLSVDITRFGGAVILVPMDELDGVSRLLDGKRLAVSKRADVGVWVEMPRDVNKSASVLRWPSVTPDSSPRRMRPGAYSIRNTYQLRVTIL